MANRQLNMRPDPPDLRDRLYNPMLQPLPSTLNVEPWTDPNVTIKNQEDTSACTGFALSGMVERLLRVQPPPPLSPYMLYYMARRYDDLPGTDDVGSTARAAMKAWHKHGACTEACWGDENCDRAVQLAPCDVGDKWRVDAFSRPLGAYYRVDHTSIPDMHAAINETRVIYVTAQVHEGWQRVGQDGRIAWESTIPILGGHAFLLVGYDQNGFWIQNSWGTGWGNGGYAHISYAEWFENGMDAWIGQLGVQITGILEDLGQGLDPKRIPQGAADPNERGRAMLSSNAAVRAQQISPFVVDMENNGVLSNRGQYHTTPDDLRALVTTRLQGFMEQWKIEVDGDELIHVAVYAHGGLTDENAASQTAESWISALYAQKIFPVFMMWETGVLDTLKDIAQDTLKGTPVAAGASFWDKTLDWWNNRMETLLSAPGTRAWDEMKKNALMDSANPAGGLQQLYQALAADDPFLNRVRSRLRLHLIGHSAGAIFHAHLLDALMKARDPAKRVAVDGIYFMAPACRVDLFKEKIFPHYQNGKVAAYTQFHLQDAVELKDDCLPLPYRRSLLYLVSDAFERGRQVPILGMERFFMADPELTNAPGKAKAWDWISAPTPITETDPTRKSESTKHGGYSADDATRTAIITRISRRAEALKVASAPPVAGVPLAAGVSLAAAAGGTEPDGVRSNGARATKRGRKPAFTKRSEPAIQVPGPRGA